MLDWIRFGIVAALFAAGLIVLFISIFGTFRFDYSLNRMHSSAMCDTLVLLLFIAACVIASGINVVSVKFLLLLLVMWFTSPVVSHVFVKTKYLTDEALCEHCEICVDDAELHRNEIKKEEEK